MVGLLGFPVEHTHSPLIHNTAFGAQGLNYAYAAFSTPSEDLSAAVRGLAALGFLGANVTIPHKQAVMSLLDDVSPQASAVGAVNTIVVRRESGRKVLYGDNTDVAGFMTPLAPFVEDIRRKPVLIFGSGGAARAVVYAVAHVIRPPSLCLAARSVGAAEEMVSAIMTAVASGVETRVVPMADAGSFVDASGLIVNCTPLGMAPQHDTTPWEREEDFHHGQVVYDLVYNPRETRLLRAAAARGATCIDGLEMLIQQASASYRQWTGRQMPVEAVREALLQQSSVSQL